MPARDSQHHHNHSEAKHHHPRNRHESKHAGSGLARGRRHSEPRHPKAHQGNRCVQFSFTGTEQTYTVPKGVHRVFVTATGGAGGGPTAIDPFFGFFLPAGARGSYRPSCGCRPDTSCS